MAYILTMPRYGANMDEGVLAEWNVEEGDEVVKGQGICAIEIEKLTNEVEASEDGVVRKIFCDEGETLPCGAPLAIIAGVDEDITKLLSEAGSGSAVSDTIEEEIAAPVKNEPAPVKAAAAPSGSAFPGEVSGIKITPKALKLAEEMGVDYRDIKGTGILNAITREDIRKNSGKTHVTETVEAKEPVSRPAASSAVSADAVPMSTVRKITARRMMESLSRSAQTSIMMDADLTDLAAVYGHKKKEYSDEGIKLSYTAIILKAVSSALVNHPIIRTIGEEGDSLRTLKDINIGLAVDGSQGLTVPVLRHVDRLDLKTVCRDLADLAGRAKIGTATPNEMTGGCFTVSNVGMYNVKYFTPILNSPESAILGVGTLNQQPVVKDGGIQIRWILSLSLTFDHRIVDGAPAARFLNEIRTSLETASILEIL